MSASTVTTFAACTTGAIIRCANPAVTNPARPGTFIAHSSETLFNLMVGVRHIGRK
jgi:hypothetical protein